MVAALCLATGAMAGLTAHTRQNALDNLLDETEPLAYTTQRLYVALSMADASVGSAFIAGGLGQPILRERYLQAIGEAAADAAIAIRVDDPPEIRQLQRTVATELPVYTGVVETARANNRSGNPVGVAYLAEASALMQQTILPAARQLHEHRADSVAVEAERQRRLPVAALIVLGGTLIALTAAQLYLTRRSRRLISPWLVAATTLLVVLFGWLTIAGTMSAVYGRRAVQQGTTPLGELTECRIYAQHARSNETLKILLPDVTADYDTNFTNDFDQLTDRLNSYRAQAGADQVARAKAARDRWAAAHRRLNDVISGGIVDSSRLAAIGAQYAAVTVEQAVLDDALAVGIAETRERSRHDFHVAARWLDLLTPAAAVLGIAAAIAVAAGFTPRIREYQ